MHSHDILRGFCKDMSFILFASTELESAARRKVFGNLGRSGWPFCQVNASLIHVGWSFSAFKLATKYVSLPWFFQPATFSLNGARRSRLKESFWRKYRAIQGRIGAVENLPTLPNLLKALGGSGRKNGETMRKGRPKNRI